MIYRYIEEKGMNPMQAAVAGTKDIGLAVMATTLSLLAVFLPIGFMGGIVGRFMARLSDSRRRLQSQFRCWFRSRSRRC